MNYNRRAEGIKRARKVISDWNNNLSFTLEPFTEDDKIFKILIKTRHMCNCHMCRNPRRLLKGKRASLTRQEQMALEVDNG